MGQPQKTKFTDEERALGVDEDGVQLTPEQRKDSVNSKKNDQKKPSEDNVETSGKS